MKKIWKFILLTFAITWIPWGIIILANQFGALSYGTPLFMVLFLIGGQGPAIAAYLMLRSSYSEKPFRSFLRWSFGTAGSSKSYLFCFILLAVHFILLTVFGSMKMGGSMFISVLMIIPMIILGGTEEIGWRGFLQPKLNKNMGSLGLYISPLLIAALWALWHLPLWFIQGTGQFGSNFYWFALSILGISYLLAALRYVTKSVFICILFHSAFNALSNSFIPIFGSAFMYIALVEVIVSLVILRYLSYKASEKTLLDLD